MSRFARFRLLTWPERRLFFGALVMLPATALALRLLGLRRVHAALRRAGCASNNSVGPARARHHVGRVTRLVAAAARHGPYKATCLPRSLALQWLLRRRGIESDLRVGVRKVAGGLEAHAWLEHEGLPLIDAPDVRERYAAFDQAIAP